MLKTKLVRVGDRELVLSQANILMSLQREELIRQAQAQPDPDPARQFIRAYLYPQLASCVIDQAPSLEEMLELPEQEVDAWFSAAKELNPHWWPESAEKKESTEPTSTPPGS